MTVVDPKRSLADYHIDNLRSLSPAASAKARARRRRLETVAMVIVFWVIHSIIGAVGPESTLAEQLFLRGSLSDTLSRVVICAMIVTISILHFRLQHTAGLERALENSSRWFSTAMQSAGSALIAADENGMVVFINPAAQVLADRSIDRAIGSRLNEVCPIVTANGEPLDLNQIINAVLKTDERYKLPVKTRFQRADGQEVHISGSMAPIGKPDNYLGVVLALHDLTEIHEADDERLRLANVVAQASDGILVVSPDGNIDYANASFIRLSGISAKQLQGAPVADFKHLLPDSQLAAGIQDAVRHSGSWEGKIELKHEGKTVHMAVAVSKLEPQHSGAVGYACLVRDITNESVLQQQLVQAQKMEVVGRLAGGVAHDFNNIITVIMGSAALLRMECDDQAALIDEITEAALRGTAITEQLKGFVRREDARPVPVNPSRELEASLPMFRRLLGIKVKLNTDLMMPISRIFCDKGQFTQIIMNLIVNARDAMPNGGTVTIGSAETMVSPEDSERLGIQPGRHVQLEVIDTGCGMSENVRKRIFEPFFTTKGKDLGTGIGLEVVRRLVTEMNGHIDVESQPGRGTTFRILVPAYTQGAESTFGDIALDYNSQEGHRVLVVDRDAALTYMAEVVLKRFGYNVRTANSDDEAKRLTEEGAVDLLIAEMEVGSTDSNALAESVVRLHPDARVIFMSGILQPPASMDSPLFLRKPFTSDDLLKASAQALEKLDPLW